MPWFTQPALSTFTTFQLLIPFILHHALVFAILPKFSFALQTLTFLLLAAPLFTFKFELTFPTQYFLILLIFSTHLFAIIMPLFLCWLTCCVSKLLTQPNSSIFQLRPSTPWSGQTLSCQLLTKVYKKSWLWNFSELKFDPQLQVSPKSPPLDLNRSRASPNSSSESWPSHNQQSVWITTVSFERVLPQCKPSISEVILPQVFWARSLRGPHIWCSHRDWWSLWIRLVRRATP